MSHQRGVSPPGDPQPEVVRQYLATTAQRELDALRAQLDARLAALEAALRQPNGGSLEDLVLELARVATAEAESASSRAAVQAQLAAQEHAAAALTDAQRTIEAERVKSERLARQVEELRTAVEAEHLTASRMKQEADEARAALEADRLSAMVLRQEVAQLEQALHAERERLAGIDVDGLRRQIEEARSQAESERATAARVGDELAAARHAIEEERAAAQRAIEEERAAARRASDEERHAAHALRERIAALERTVEQERGRDAGTELATARRDVEHLRGLLQAERDNAKQLQEELADAQRSADRRKSDDEARRLVIETLERQYADLEVRYREAVERASTLQPPPAGPSDEDADLANQLATAKERIRALELQLYETAAATRDVDLGSMLDAKPAPPSALAGQRARRFAFPPRTKVLLDRDGAVLVDLSVTGAQVLCAASPDVGRVVTLTLVSDEVPSFCQARFLWARREQTNKKDVFVYRAGLVFTDADEKAIDAFIAQHSIG